MMETPQDEAERRGIRSLGLAAQPRADLLVKVAELVDAGKLKVSVNRTFPLADAAAMDFRLKTTAPGKVVKAAAAAIARRRSPSAVAAAHPRVAPPTALRAGLMTVRPWSGSFSCSGSSASCAAGERGRQASSCRAHTRRRRLWRDPLFS